MTKAEAGRLGGLKTYQLYKRAHMQKIGLRGAEVFWSKYRLQAVGTSRFAIIERATNRFVRIRNS